jgi:Domain of unknown function (DUF5911)
MAHLSRRSEPRVSRAYRDGTMVLETAFETADGRVALIDFMPIGQANSSVIRLIKGERGKVAMRLHLTPRFDYGATVPWVTQLEDGSGVSAVAGPSQVAVRSPVALQGKNFATVAEFDGAEGECVPFVLTHGPSHLLPSIGARRCRRWNRSGTIGRPAAAAQAPGGNRSSARC